MRRLMRDAALARPHAHAFFPEGDPCDHHRFEQLMKAHRYFAFLTLFCMAMTIVTGYEVGKR